MLQAVIDVILNQGALGLAYGLLHGMQLLRDIHALTAILDHGDDAAQMALGALQALHDIAVALVSVAMAVFVIAHALSPMPR